MNGNKTRAELCNDCKHGGYGVDDYVCDIGKDNTNPDCPFFVSADDVCDFSGEKTGVSIGRLRRRNKYAFGR
jgi:hypothetical protein